MRSISCGCRRFSLWFHNYSVTIWFFVKSPPKKPVAFCIELLEPRQLFAFPNWAGIGPAIALVPQSAGQLASVSVVNFGTTVYTGPLNVTNTLNRIRADGTPDRSDDGIVYNSPQASGLPVDGTYYEFTVEPTGGTDQNFSSISFPGPMRILLATGGDCYFTGDHYVTFEPVYIAGTVNQPTIGSFAVSPTTVTAGTTVTLTASNVAETGGTITAVNFYRESNGTAGLQIGSDTFINTGVHSATTWILGTSTTGLAAGTYTYYAVATDSNNLSSAASSATLTVSSVATGSTLAGWDVSSQLSYGTQGLGAATVATGVTNSLGLTRGGGVTTSGTAAGAAWGGNGWSITTSAAGISANEFVSFGLTVSANSTASISAIDMNYRRSSSGPPNGYWQYQVGASGTWTLIGDFTNEFSSTSSNGSTIAEINLSGISALQTLGSGTVVNFRLVPYGGTSTSGNLYVYHETAPDLTIKGSVVSGSPLVLSGPATYLKLDADGLHVDLWNSTTDTGSPSQSLLLTQISQMSYTGSAADDSLTIDFSAGDPLIPSGLSFDGGTGGQNSLNIIGTSGGDSMSVGASTISFGSIPVTYINTTSITFAGGNGSDVLTQTAQPGGGASLSFVGNTALDTLNISGGTFTFPAAPANAGITPIVLNAISLTASAKLVIASPNGQANRSVLELTTLHIAGTLGSNNWQGQLDLNSNNMIIEAGDLPTVTNLIASGYNLGNWIGQGIISSAAANDPSNLTTLGVMQDLTAAPFDDQIPVAGAVLIKYTYFGDANLDGIVNGDDYTLIDNGFNTQATGWYNGDFNYDGSINGDDYLLIDNAANAGITSLSTVAADEVTTTPIHAAPSAIVASSLNFNSSVLADFDTDNRRDKDSLHPGLWAVR
jgi:guanyl-specific ribonuclease Sa